MLQALLVLYLVLLGVAAAPKWPYSRSWGYLPSGIIAILVAIVAIVLALG